MKVNPVYDPLTGRIVRASMNAVSFADSKLLSDLTSFLNGTLDGEVIVTTLTDGQIGYTRYKKANDHEDPPPA